MSSDLCRLGQTNKGTGSFDAGAEQPATEGPLHHTGEWCWRDLPQSEGDRRD